MKVPIKQNEPAICRWLRICVGIILIVLGGAVVTGTWGTVLIILGVLVIVSGIVGYCPCSAVCSTEGKEGGSCCCFAPKKESRSNN